jgi:trk system potassium uptake protein
VLLRPSGNDIRLVANDLGRIMGVVAAAGLFPLGWAIVAREWAAVASFSLMVGLALIFAAAGVIASGGRRREPAWSHGLVVVSLTWLIVPLLGALPLYLSGHFDRPLDAYFDAMSGLTTTGLSLIHDLDHLASSVNIWRHTLHFLGGQGIVLAALILFSTSGALSLYQAEGRDEKVLPSVSSTARFIWYVAIVHGVIGISLLTLDGLVFLGFEPVRSVFHATNVFMAAFDTGGFSPQSTSLGYYHSAVYEATAAVLMVAGAMSFGLHHAIWRRRAGLTRNLEVRTILATMAGTMLVTLVGLALIGAFEGPLALARKGAFHVVSAHTGAGFSTVSSAELRRWSGLAFAGIATAMALGGMSSSTAGGVKSLRIGLTVKAMTDTVRRALLPERAVVSRVYHQYGRRRLSPELAQSVMAVSLLYVGLYLLGAAVGAAYGYPLQDALFESISASAAVGLSVGVVAPGMPIPLEILMILQMWIGRLEFVAVFALLGFGWSLVAGK